MFHARILPFCAVIGALVFAPALAMANHHQWKINEIFSNATGTVQFIEMTNGFNNEDIVGPHSIQRLDLATFDFLTNLGSTATAGQSLLIATEGFATLVGAPKPDYTMDDGFLVMAGDTLTYAGGFDEVTFGELPDDGIMSVDRNGVEGVNSPTNFAGDTGSINGAIPAAPPWALVVLAGLLGGLCLLALRREVASVR